LLSTGPNLEIPTSTSGENCSVPFYRKTNCYKLNWITSVNWIEDVQKYCTSSGIYVFVRM